MDVGEAQLAARVELRHPRYFVVTTSARGDRVIGVARCAQARGRSMIIAMLMRMLKR